MCFVHDNGLYHFLGTIAANPTPPLPFKGQLINTGIVAVSSGIIATSIFYKARNASKSPYIVSAVDATQSGEVIFSLAGEILLLNGALPNLTGGIGIIIIVGVNCRLQFENRLVDINMSNDSYEFH